MLGGNARGDRARHLARPPAARGRRLPEGAAPARPRPPRDAALPRPRREHRAPSRARAAIVAPARPRVLRGARRRRRCSTPTCCASPTSSTSRIDTAGLPLDGREREPAPVREAVSFSLVTFSHTVFALPFALLSAVLAAGGVPAASDALLDPRRDGRARARPRWPSTGSRTATSTRGTRARASREIPAGRGLGAVRLALFCALSAAVFVFAAWRLNPLCLALSPRRARDRPRLLLHEALHARSRTSSSGLGLAIAPVGAWIAVTGRVRGAARRPRPLGPLLGRGLRRHLQPAGRGVRPRARPLLAAGAPRRPPRARPSRRSSTRSRSRSSTRVFVLAGGGPLFGAGVVLAGVFLVRQHVLVSAGGPLARRRRLLHGERLALGRRLPLRRRRRPPPPVAAPVNSPPRAGAHSEGIPAPPHRDRGPDRRREDVARRASSRSASAGTQILEDVTNPFLADFYAGKKGAAFQTQIYFLLSRYQQQQEIAQIDLFRNLVDRRLHVREGQDLRVPHAERRRDRALRQALRARSPRASRARTSSSTSRRPSRRASAASGSGAAPTRRRSRPST